MYMIFDIGGSFVKYAVMDRSGNIYIKDKFPTPKTSYQELLAKMTDVIANYQEYTFRGISICCPGVVDSDQGIVYYGGCLTYLHEQNLKRDIYDCCQIPVAIENDGKAAALAELWRGAVDKIDHGVILVLGSAIGGGIVINGKLHRGKNYSAGEVSYMVGDTTEQEAVYKMCGFDASAPKMVADVAVANGLKADADGRIVFQHIKPENSMSWGIFCDYCHKIARMIVSLQYILDPEVFVICGGISAQTIVRDQIMQEVEKMYQANPMYLLMPKVENSILNNDANLYGALYHFIEEYIEKQEEAVSTCPHCQRQSVQVEVV